MSYKGIDISEYQKVDYSKLKAQGIEFAIIRAGFGKNESQKDSKFEEHYKGLKNAGIKVGCYLYSYVSKVENAKLEAQNCLNFIKGKKFELPVFYDLEDKITLPLGKEKITKCAISFCEEIEKAGFKAGVYANLNWFKNHIDVNSIINKGYKIWCAQYYVTFTGHFPINYWQYSSIGKINGITGKVDLNYCYDDISKTVDNVDKSVEKSKIKFEVGKTYTLQVDLNVRVGAGTNKRIKNYIELTADGRKHAYKQLKAVLKKGTKVTCQDLSKEGKNIWIKIPSGWICAYENGKYYVK